MECVYITCVHMYLLCVGEADSMEDGFGVAAVPFWGPVRKEAAAAVQAD